MAATSGPSRRLASVAAALPPASSRSFSSAVSRSRSRSSRRPTPHAREAGSTIDCAPCGRKPIVWPVRPSRSSAMSASWKSSATSASPKPRRPSARWRPQGGSQRDEPPARAARGAAVARPARPEDAARGNLQARTQRLSPAAALGWRLAWVRARDPGDDRADLPAGARAQRFPDHARGAAEGARRCSRPRRRSWARGTPPRGARVERPNAPSPSARHSSSASIRSATSRPSTSASCRWRATGWISSSPGSPTSGAGRQPCRWRPSAAGSNGR